MAAFVVGRNGHVDVLGRRVCIAKRHDWDVDVASLLDGLRVGTWVGHDDQARLLERARDVVGEVAGRETTSDGRRARVRGELEHGALTIGAGRNDGDVSRIVDGDNDTCGEDNFFPTCALASHSFLVDRYTADGNSAYQVFPMLMMLIPSGRVFQTYGSM